MTDHIAGNPASFPPSVALWEDSDDPDAAHFNLGPEDLADRTANLDARATAEVTARTLLAQAVAARAANLSTQTAWGFTVSAKPIFDTFHARWLVGKSSNKVMKSYDGTTWSVQLGADLAADATALIARPTDGVIVAIKASASTMARLTPSTDTWVEYTGPTWTTSGARQGGTYLAGAANLFLAWESRASAVERLYSSSNGTAWNADMGASLPSGIAHNGATVFDIISAQSATRLLLFGSRPEFASYSYSDDGATWTTQTMPTLLTNEQVVGATYDSVSGKFFFLVSRASPTVTIRVFSSSTGLTGSWSLVASITGFAAQSLQAVATSGATALASLWSDASGARAVISVDGGVTWRYASFAPTGNSGYFYAKPGGDGARLFYADPTNYSVSPIIGLMPAAA